jgi:hypothetical protein
MARSAWISSRTLWLGVGSACVAAGRGAANVDT